MKIQAELEALGIETKPCPPADGADQKRRASDHRLIQGKDSRSRQKNSAYISKAARAKKDLLISHEYPSFKRILSLRRSPERRTKKCLGRITPVEAFVFLYSFEGSRKSRCSNSLFSVGGEKEKNRNQIRLYHNYGSIM